MGCHHPAIGVALWLRKPSASQYGVAICSVGSSEYLQRLRQSENGKTSGWNIRAAAKKGPSSVRTMRSPRLSRGFSWTEYGWQLEKAGPFKWEFHTFCPILRNSSGHQILQAISDLLPKFQPLKSGSLVHSLKNTWTELLISDGTWESGRCS